MIERSLAGQRAIRERAATLRALLKADTPDMTALPDARWQLGVTIMQHMTVEDRHLYANLARDPRPDLAKTGRRYQAESAQHIADYAEYAKLWPSDRVRREWSRYRVASAHELGLLEQRMRLVERELYPLARATIDTTIAHPPSTSWTRSAFDIKDSVVGR